MTKPLNLHRCAPGGMLLACGAVAALGFLAAPARADLLAYWNFNDFVDIDPDGSNPSAIPADHGSGFIDTSVWAGGVQMFAFGTPQNALFGDPAGNSLRLHSGPAGLGFDIHISMSGLQDLSLSLATGASGHPGHMIQTWSWSTDGTNFTEFKTIETMFFVFEDDPWDEPEFDLSSITALNDAAEVILRVELSGGNQSGGTFFDNLQIHANVIPAPSVLALLGLAGLGATRRRRP